MASTGIGKITSGISALRHLKEFVDKKTFLSVYNAIIQLYFNHCCEVWSVFGETQSARLQNLHNRAARFTANMPNEISQETALSALGWEPLKQQRKKAKAKIMFKILNNMGPECLNKLFTFTKDVLSHNHRDSSKLCLPQPHTNNMKKSLMFDGASIWNSLPSNIRHSKSFQALNEKLLLVPIQTKIFSITR